MIDVEQPGIHMRGREESSDSNRSVIVDESVSAIIILATSRDDIRNFVHKSIGVIVNAAAHQHKLFDQTVTAAIDITTVGYWADSSELEMVTDTPPDKDDRCINVLLIISGKNIESTIVRRGCDEYVD